jgi:hypothetical protein
LRFWVAKVLHLLKLLLPRQSPLRLPRQNRHLQPNLRLLLRLLSNQRLHQRLYQLPNQHPLLPLRRTQPQRLLMWRQQPVICCHR